ncbi:hypothetical protein Hanom_Chr07g00674361 [Helianthus anomalus]
MSRNSWRLFTFCNNIFELIYYVIEKKKKKCWCFFTETTKHNIEVAASTRLQFTEIVYLA